MRQGHRVERELPDAIELVVVAVRAGHLPLSAVHTALPFMAPTVRAGFAQVLHQVQQGARFSDALSVLGHVLGPSAASFAHHLATAERDGLPLAPVLDHLAAEARAQRRRSVESRARQLPVRMALPLTLCTLPAFALMALVPLLLSALSSLDL